MPTQATVRKTPFSGQRVVVGTARSIDEVAARLSSVMERVDAGEIEDVARSANSAEAFAREVEARFVGESGFMLFAEFDHTGWIARYGLQRRVRRWILGNPLIAITMLKYDVSAGLFAPVEILLTDQPETGGAEITYVLPSSLIAVGDNPPLRAAAEALDAKLEAMILKAADAFS